MTKAHPPVTPGEILRKDFLDPLGIPQSRLAQAIGLPVSLVRQRGNRLRELREAQNLSVGDLAEAAEISPAEIARFERGDIDRARIGTLWRYIEGLGAHLRLEVEIGDCPLRIL